MWGDSLGDKLNKLMSRVGGYNQRIFNDICGVVTKCGDKSLYVVDFPSFLCHHPVFKPQPTPMVVETHSKSTFFNELDRLIEENIVLLYDISETYVRYTTLPKPKKEDLIKKSIKSHKM